MQCFWLVNNFKLIGMLLNVVHGQVQKKKPITKGLPTIRLLTFDNIIAMSNSHFQENQLDYWSSQTSVIRKPGDTNGRRQVSQVIEWWKALVQVLNPDFMSIVPTSNPRPPVTKCFASYQLRLLLLLCFISIIYFIIPEKPHNWRG